MKPSTFAPKMLFLMALSTCYLHSSAQSKQDDKLIQSLPFVQGEGVVPASSISLSEKATESSAITKGAAALSASIYDAWWTYEFDVEGDGYVQSATLNWDADVIGGTGSLDVYIMLYYKPSTSSSWTLVTTTASYTITGSSSADAYYINLHNLSHGLYDWRIDLYQTGTGLYYGFYGPANDEDLNDFAMETAAEDVEATVYIGDAWWTNELDSDGDGYVQGAYLNWSENVSDEYSTISVYEKIYYKLSGSTSWSLLTTTNSKEISGTTHIENFPLPFNWFLPHDTYDWRIDIYRSGESAEDESYGASNDSDLNDYAMEENYQDVEPAGGIEDAWWTNEVDADGDTYTQGARLNWDPYVNDGYSTLTVYENIYWKLSTSTSWDLLNTTSSHTITGNSGSDTYYIDPNTAFDHNLYDWRIDIVRLGESAEDDSYGSSDDSDLNDYPMEADWQDVEPEAYIYNVHWFNEVDLDGDGYFRSTSLGWTVEVNDGYSSLNVNLDIYYKPSASGTWLAAENFATHLLSGAWSYGVNIDSLDHNTYDFRIDIFQSGNTTADHSYMDYQVVNAYPMETAAQDAVGDASISGSGSICQGASDTFTASASDASSYFWELPSGWVINSGQGTSSLVVTAGSNSGNICVTPSNNSGSGTLTCHAVIVHALPGGANVSGSISVCTGSIVDYTAQASNADSYTWTVPSDWTIISGQGTSTISVSVGISSGDVCATPSNGWCNGAEGCVAATVFGIPDMPTITGEESVISGSTQSYSAVALGANTFTWTVPEGWQIISGQGSDTIEVLAGDVSSYICVTPINDCGEGWANCIPIRSNKLPGPVTISGPDVLCKELGGLYIADALDTDSYSWTLSGNWIIDSGQGSYSVIITPGDSIGTLCVTPTNSFGEGEQECIQISTHTLPAQPTQILGETNPIVNESYTYSVELIPDVESYQWNTSDGSIEGESHEVDFIWGTTGHQGISVKTRNECGESELLNLNITVQETVTGLAEVKRNDLLIYPNPSSDYLKIKGQYEQLNGSLVSLTDVSGKVVYLQKIELEVSSNEFVMDISQMYPGIYILSLQTTDLLVTKMLLIELN